MPFGKIKLNDGRLLPEIGFGSWLIGSGQTVVEQVRLLPLCARNETDEVWEQTEQAIEVGFDHIGESK